MEDMERYGDYNEVDTPPTKNPVTMILKILVLVVCLGVAAFLVFRIILFNYYPASMTRLYFNDSLTSYYNENDGKISALTQSLRSPYDDSNDGHFFCDNLIVVRDADHLQISARFNTSLYQTIKDDYGIDVSALGKDAFGFKLVRDAIGDDKNAVVEIGTLDACIEDSLLMYRYFKLVFDDVDFGLDEGEDKVEWIRLEITVNGAEMDSPYIVPIYENNEDYSRFEEYILSAEEKPQ